MEVCNCGDLYHFINNGEESRIQDVEYSSLLKFYVKSIINGLIAIHDNEIIHRDIKSANILFKTPYLLKIADFGLSKESESQSIVTRTSGTYFYIPPEAYISKKISQQTDIWSLGILIFEMYERSYPIYDVKELVNYKSPEENIKFRKIKNSLLKDLISLCLQRERINRPTSRELLNHGFFFEDTEFEKCKDDYSKNGIIERYSVE